MTETTIYDQPLNEMIRVCLRLEQLFHKIDHQLQDATLVGTRSAVNSVLQLLHLVDRPDLKSKLAKELNLLQASLVRYSHAPEVDTGKLNHIIRQLDELSRSLIDNNMKIGQRLRDIELLNILRLHLATPGGSCSFDTPIYYCWLQQPAHLRQATISNWLKEFAQIKQIVTLLLDLVRQHAKAETKTAIHGFHQELLDPQSNLRMVRIKVDNKQPIYPEVSIGRHFLSVRMFALDVDKRPAQFTDNVPFVIEYCNF